MYKINFQQPIHIHFIGIGGISMSGLAEILLKEQFKISGSDSKESKLTKKLEQLGASISYGHSSSNIASSTDLIVYTAAIHPDNPELKEAALKSIPMLTRAELLGQIMENYKYSIAVSGTHGKTTTTSMISAILLAAQKDPTISVGGILKSIDGNIRAGSSPYFLTEACEYTNSFLHFNPYYALILNIEEDHLDFFKDLDDIRHSFHNFALNISENGFLIINGEIENIPEITKDLSCKTLTYGLDSSNDFYAEDIHFFKQGITEFTLYHNHTSLGVIQIHAPGLHNVSNAVAAITLSLQMGIDFETIKEALFSFNGPNRRFEYKGKLNNITIIDDYAHHPTEISAALNAAKDYSTGRTICIFQPHTYSRTKAFLTEFAKALSIADLVVLSDIYAAREKNMIGISSKDLLKELELLGVESYYFPSFDEIENFLLKNSINDDLLITMGAGDIYQVGDHLLGL